VVDMGNNNPEDGNKASLKIIGELLIFDAQEYFNTFIYHKSFKLCIILVPGGYMGYLFRI
jgi:hypothetical protein